MFVDSEAKAIKRCTRGALEPFIRPHNIVTDKAGRGGNFAFGFQAASTQLFTNEEFLLNEEFLQGSDRSSDKTMKPSQQVSLQSSDGRLPTKPSGPYDAGVNKTIECQSTSQPVTRDSEDAMPRMVSGSVDSKPKRLCCSCSHSPPILQY